ncbi:HamA C-terminal domain-containing protein [Metapseudomonas otitidis]|uniref:HamA C-terminal domain-containing protein n=1 Tax=Metapseudomonas otitidis TaxID=319939 RepID=UPI00366E331A
MVNLKDINKLIDVDIDDHKQCLDLVEHTQRTKSLNTTLRFHHLKFDGNGRPMSKALAELLYQYIIHYCIAAKNRPSPITAKESAKLIKEARKLFRHPDITDDSPDKTGEAGEALLFFLMESVIQAPQIVSKMELKTNRKLEANGSDGIHAKWNETDEIVDFYFGESKLYRKIEDAITSALKSIESFHADEIYKHEFTMITKHFKYADIEVQKAVTEHIKLGEPGPGARVNHACLIGYNWDAYENKNNKSSKELAFEFKEKLSKETPNIAALLDKKLEGFSKKHLCLDVFFIPFPSVQDFRNEFNEALD